VLSYRGRYKSSVRSYTQPRQLKTAKTALQNCGASTWIMWIFGSTIWFDNVLKLLKLMPTIPTASVSAESLKPVKTWNKTRVGKKTDVM